MALPSFGTGERRPLGMLLRGQARSPRASPAAWREVGTSGELLSRVPAPDCPPGLLLPAGTEGVPIFKPVAELSSCMLRAGALHILPEGQK